MMTDFIGGNVGDWEVTRFEVVKGESLEAVSRIHIVQNSATTMRNGQWTLRGFSSNVPYTDSVRES